mmetsp:Transcript_10692/g.22640  ORF Transcript_10692/g.22640 Transcript_10692/m.22640 type:complete len:205 (+) Transcript_10692:791-1405(+)
MRRVVTANAARCSHGLLDIFDVMTTTSSHMRAYREPTNVLKPWNLCRPVPAKNTSSASSLSMPSAVRPYIVMSEKTNIQCRPQTMPPEPVIRNSADISTSRYRPDVNKSTISPGWYESKTDTSVPAVTAETTAYTSKPSSRTCFRSKPSSGSKLLSVSETASGGDCGVPTSGTFLLLLTASRSSLTAVLSSDKTSRVFRCVISS